VLREYKPPVDLKDTAYTFSITVLSKTTEDTTETDANDEEYIDTHWETETWESNLSKEDAVKVLLEFLRYMMELKSMSYLKAVFQNLYGRV
jgi:hypothetical protein